MKLITIHCESFMFVDETLSGGNSAKYNFVLLLPAMNQEEEEAEG